jgi:hypothetical protein
MRAGAVLSSLFAVGACTGAAEPPPPVPPPSGASLPPPSASASTASSTPPSPCASDDDCGYDPAADRCGSDPRLNRQPPLLDQGVVCFCDEHARICQTLRVWPIPCEGDGSCAVSLTPRPHPIPATEAHPHEHGKPCVDFAWSSTCERTNICTMHRLACRDGGSR